MAAFVQKSRHGTVFYFRRRVPDALRSLIGCAYLVKSLGTEIRSQAIIAARHYGVLTDQIFQELRTMSGPKIDAKQFVKDFLEDPDLKLRLRLAGMKLALEEQQQEINRQEAEITGLIDQHQKELNVATKIAAAVAHAPAHASTTSLTFADGVTDYLTNNKQLKANTRGTYKGKLKHAQEYFGATTQLHTIGQAEFSKYAQKVAAEVQDPTTAANYIQTVAGLLNWFRIREGWGAAITTKTLLPKKTRPDTADRDAFTIEQLAVLFENAARYRASAPHKYWATILPAFTGCRIEELAQLNLETDLLHDAAAGIWYFDLNANPDPDGVTRKSLKNKASWRTVPIHQALIDDGLIEYLHQQRDAGLRPFENGWKPRIYEDGKAYKWNHYLVKWAGRELEALHKQGLIVKAGLSYFHSQRHSFSRHMTDAGVSAEVCEALLGHQYGDSERERYNKLKSNYSLLSREGIAIGLSTLAKLVGKP